MLIHDACHLSPVTCTCHQPPVPDHLSPVTCTCHLYLSPVPGHLYLSPVPGHLYLSFVPVTCTCHLILVLKYLMFVVCYLHQPLQPCAPQGGRRIYRRCVGHFSDIVQACPGHASDMRCALCVHVYRHLWHLFQHGFYMTTSRGILG